MGTRHLIKVIDEEGELKVAQYGQWDGYISDGQGEGILEFLKEVDLKIFKDKLKNVKFISDEEINAKCKIENWRDKFPELSRDTGGRILNLIMEKDKLELYNSVEFENDGLFCEYCYTINLKDNTFSVWDKSYNLNNLPTLEKLIKECD